MAAHGAPGCLQRCAVGPLASVAVWSSVGLFLVDQNSKGCYGDRTLHVELQSCGCEDSAVVRVAQWQRGPALQVLVRGGPGLSVLT